MIHFMEELFQIRWSILKFRSLGDQTLNFHEWEKERILWNKTHILGKMDSQFPMHMKKGLKTFPILNLDHRIETQNNHQN